MSKSPRISFSDLLFRPQAFLVFFIILSAGISACAKKDDHLINLMPAPKVYSEGIVDPFSDLGHKVITPPFDIFYATDRKPDRKGNRFYLNERGLNLHLGNAKAILGPGEYTWEEALRVSLLKNRTDKYPLQITAVEEIGVLDRTVTVFTPKDLIPDDPEAASEEFAQRVNDKLARSNRKDIYIYVHGYKVEFSNPLLVATELWHFLGYDGVFIAYAWPSTPATLAYASDLESAALSAHNLRIFTEFLAEETNVEHIHIIGYSAGTRLVMATLAQAALIHSQDDKGTVQQQRRIGRVILVGSDIDRQLVGAYLVEGLLKVPKSIAIYISNADRALAVSRRLFRRERLGQTWSAGLNTVLVEYLNTTPELQFIDVTAVKGARVKNGHDYFRASPSVSSDILLSLMYDLGPSERGLTRSEDSPIWGFPAEYEQRLRNLLQAQ